MTRIGMPGPAKRVSLALWLVPVPDLGGVARHVLDVTRVGIPGWRIVVMCPEGALAERLRTQGSAVTTAPFGPGAGVRASVRALASAARALRPDVVHSHLAYADIIAAVAPLPRGTRRFTTEHGIAGDDAVYHESGAQARAMALVHRLRASRFDGLIAVSHATRAAMLAKWHVKKWIEVIPNGVDLPAGERTPRAEDDTLRVLSLSRLAPEKRIDVLIDAFAIVRRERPDATLTVAGEGPLRGQLVDHVRRRGLVESVSFPGFMDASASMNNADVVAQLSVWENLSYTLLDAAARGLRVVASAVGGNSEVLGPGSLVQSVDPETVAHALLVGRNAGDAAPHLTTCEQMCARLAGSYSTAGEDRRC